MTAWGRMYGFICMGEKRPGECLISWSSWARLSAALSGMGVIGLDEDRGGATAIKPDDGLLFDSAMISRITNGRP